MKLKYRVIRTTPDKARKDILNWDLLSSAKARIETLKKILPSKEWTWDILVEEEVKRSPEQINDIEQTVTDLEKEVLNIIAEGDEYEETPTEGFANIMDSFKGSKNQLKGVLGSLEKKELIFIGEFPSGKNSYHLDCDSSVFEEKKVELF